MDIGQFKRELGALYAENKVKSVFGLLKEKLSQASEKYITFLAISQRFNQLQDERMAGMIDYQAANMTANNIGLNLLHFIRTLTAADIQSVPKKVHQELPNELLLLTENEYPEKIANFFKQLNIPNVTVRKTNLLETLDVSKYDIVIFDNRDLAVCFNQQALKTMSLEAKTMIEDRIAKMEFLIQHSVKFMIHYGNQLFWINGHRERVQAANSQFSLYARTKEVIEFINTYRV